MLLDVRAWLEAEGFGHFADLFESKQVDGDALALMTDAHLKELGIPLGPRIKLRAAISRLAEEGAPMAERRRLTVVFVDLVGSTAFSNRLDPEELRDLIRGYQQAIARAVAPYDAHVARYLGDGALIYFGYPRAHEDDAERAVRAGLAILREVAALRAPAGEPLAAHIGIATGLVVVGDLLGAGAATERAVVGETPNVAKRLQEIAAGGEIVVSAQTRALTGRIFDWRDLGPQQVKGLPQPIVAYALAAERALESRFDGRLGSLLPMVGREAELATLMRLWGLATEGRGQVVLLTGEAGIGKSRLVRELEQVIGPEAHARITNQCSPYHRESPLHPMIQQLARAAGIDSSQAPGEQLDRAQALLPGADRQEDALIAALLGLDAESRYGKLGLTPDQQRARTFGALLNQLVGVSERQPVVWVMEDAHWIDPTTSELLAMCADRVAHMRVLAIVTARPELVPELGTSPHITRIALQRLGRSEVAAIASQVAHGKSLPQTLVAEIASKTDGIPLFVEELTKTILETGALRESGEAYLVDGPPRRLAVPASLHDSMMARLDRHAALKEVAQAAACIGREFSHELLAAACDLPPEALADGLSRLHEAELIFPRGGRRGGHYLFKHALVRDAAYESLLNSRREEIHARILAALERRADSAPEILAQHAGEAGLAERAIEYWQRAGMLALARPAYREALAHFNQALHLVERGGDDRQSRERRLKLNLLIGQTLIPLCGYGHSDTVEAFIRAQRLVAEIGDGPHGFPVAYAMWVAHYVRGEHAKALAFAWEMHERARREDSDGRMLTALRALGIEQMITGELVAARATFDEAQKLAYVLSRQSREHRIAVAHRFAADPDIATQFHVALTLWALGEVGRARRLTAEAVAAARAMGHVHTLGHALTHGAIFAAVMRDAEGAGELARETMAFADEHDMELWRGYGSILCGYAAVLEARAAHAIPLLERGFRHLARTQTGAMVPAFRAVNAFALASGGRIDAAAEEVRLVHAELEGGTERYFWPEALRWLGDCYRLLPGPAGEDEAAYTRALQLARAQSARSFELGAATSLAGLWAARGETERAWNLLAPAHGALGGEGACTPGPRQAAQLLQGLRPQAVAKLPDPA